MELFNNFEPWGIEDLNEDDKNRALDYGCEPGKKYVGDPDGCWEVPQCPFCGVVYDCNHPICRHLVFHYELGSNEYVELNKQLELYYWEKYKTLEHKAGDIHKEKDDVDEKSPPTCLDFENMFPEIIIWETQDQFGAMGATCGFAPDEFLKKLKKFNQIRVVDDGRS